MRKFLSRFLPARQNFDQYRWLKPFGSRLHHPSLWHLNRHSTAGGLAVGLFCGLVPGPLQVLSATVVSVIWRVNLPLAVLTTLYTNPLTIVPLYMAAYQLGVWVTGSPNGLQTIHFPELHWNDWLSELVRWTLQLGTPLLIGVPLLALALALAGYFVTRLIWRVTVVLKWRARKRRRVG
ncbi:MAG: DUF2062 domain-containing protein [Gallionella sp.]|nr:DUF2062 domain-containing protein [Gallionella sp.]MDD4946432.1 DUF2062 domain-containing protein [Gallionella sp.]MDD5611843.1 DUF2062 domain-containing protein [Gallionella sp.]